MSPTLNLLEEAHDRFARGRWAAIVSNRSGCRSDTIAAASNLAIENAALDESQKADSGRRRSSASW